MPIYHVEVERRYQVLIEAEDESDAERKAPYHADDIDPDENTTLMCRIERIEDLGPSGWDALDTPFRSKLTMQEIFDAIEAERAAAPPPPCPHTADLFAAGTESDSQPELGPSETRTAP